MPSIHRRKDSPYWHCAFYLPDGRRTLRSTGTADKEKANSICLKLAEASKQARKGLFVESRARQAIADIYEIGNSESLPESATKDFLNDWLAKKSLEVADSTMVEYRRVIKEFIVFLDSKADKSMDVVTVRDAAAFRSSLAKRVSGGTVNKALKILRSAWSQAFKESLIQDNVFNKVDLVKANKTTRRAFTLEELKRIIEECSDEWKSIVLIGFYTGQRLGDIARLTWSNVDLQHEEIRFTTQKTKRTMILPIPKPLMIHLLSLPTADTPEAALHPVAASQSIPTLSNQFRDILANLGLVDRTNHKTTGKGRNVKRNTGGLSFHCLRHTTTSALKNSGVSNAIAMELIGHESEAVSRAYTHIETKTLRRAVDGLPDLLEVVK